MQQDWADLLAAFGAAQSAFWTAAATGTLFDGPEFAPPDWQAFDGGLVALIEQTLPEADAVDLVEAQRALAAYRDLLAGAWRRIRRDFEVQRRALAAPGHPPDWRAVRDRWLAVAEMEFIQLQRQPEFLSAQADLLSCAVTLLEKIPPPQRRALASMRRAAGGAAETLSRLGLDGIRIAETPGKVIWRGGQTRLTRYDPLPGARPNGRTLVICHGLIGRQTMTDLLPDRSLVRQLLAAGTDVLSIDWGDAERQDPDFGTETVVAERLPAALEAARAATGQTPVLMGICQGGTFAACLAARGASLTGLILAVAPIDFHADEQDANPAHGLANLWIRSLDPGDLRRLIELEGTLSGAFMGGVFNQLNPVRTLAKYSVEMVQTALDPAQFRLFMAMEKWLADRPDLPGRLAREWLIDCYQDNALVRGKLKIAGAPVRLDRIACPVLNVYATADHIVPAPCSRALGAYLDPARYTELALPTGHVGTFVSERAQTLLAPQILRWMEELD